MILILHSFICNDLFLDKKIIVRDIRETKIIGKHINVLFFILTIIPLLIQRGIPVKIAID